MAESLSLEYQTRLSWAKEEAVELKAVVYLHNRNRIEGQRRLFQNICRMEGKIRRESTSQVIVADSRGVTTEYTGKEQLKR